MINEIQQLHEAIEKVDARMHWDHDNGRYFEHYVSALQQVCGVARDVVAVAQAQPTQAEKPPCKACNDTGRIEHPNISGHDYSVPCKQCKHGFIPPSQQIEEVLSWAQTHSLSGTTDHEEGTYEEGIYDGIRWMLGEINGRPDQA